ncbi:MAG: hypothetical protein ACOX7F_03545 [Eubacteriales bacterium]|jgi:hypothetical protein
MKEPEEYRLNSLVLFAVATVSILFTLPGLLYDYYTKSPVWYGVLLAVSLSLNAGWWTWMYQAGKTHRLRYGRAILYFLLCAVVVAFQMHKQMDALAYLLLPTAMVVFLWQRVCEVFIQEKNVLESAAQCIPVVLLSLFYLWGYCQERGK